MAVFYEFDEVDSFTVVAIGQPGQRMFLLQARRGAQRVTVKCEKQQAGAIADYLRKVLIDLPSPTDKPMPGTLRFDGDDPVFVLGPIGLGYDRATDRVLVQLEEMIPVDDEADDDVDDGLGQDRGHVRVFLTRSQAAAFCEHADTVVSAGRPACVFCGNPMDPDGHPCPRMN